MAGAQTGLRERYRDAVATAKRLRWDGAAVERDGKLYFRGTVNATPQKTQIVDAIAAVDGWQREVVVDIQIRPARARIA